jgi:DNA-directed RNA polymerase specialized sigma24 family protein
MMSRNFTPEQILIDRLVSGDATAVEELTRRYCYSLYCYCMTKLHSPEDAKRIVRNLFISLWENRDRLPADFSLSLHLYTEVRKSVVQCINSKLINNRDVSAIEEQIIPGFSASELQKARLPVDTTHTIRSNHYLPVRNGKYEEHWWSRHTPSINLKDLSHALKNMLNAW